MDFELLVGIFPQVLLDGLLLGFMYALIALGYTMVYGVLEFINFAHSEIFIVGAFVGVEILLSLKNAGVLETLPWPLVLLGVMLAGMLASGALAVSIERIAYRPLRSPATHPVDLGHRHVVLPAGRHPPRGVALAQRLQPRVSDAGATERSVRADVDDRRLRQVAGRDRGGAAHALGSACARESNEDRHRHPG